MPLSTRMKVKFVVLRALSNERYIRENLLDVPLVPHSTCQFMGGMELGPMCGAPSRAGYSYCPDHWRECYLPRHSRDR